MFYRQLRGNHRLQIKVEISLSASAQVKTQGEIEAQFAKGSAGSTNASRRRHHFDFVGGGIRCSRRPHSGHLIVTWSMPFFMTPFGFRDGKPQSSLCVTISIVALEPHRSQMIDFRLSILSLSRPIQGFTNNKSGSTKMRRSLTSAGSSVFARVEALGLNA
jgi:hypothetical protein